MRSMQGSVVVVGNGVAGFACASRLGEHGVDVTMIGPGLPHDRPPLSKRALATGRLPLLADEEKLAARGICHVDGRVVEADLDGHVLTVAPRDGGDPFELVPERIVWATGLTYPRPPIPGAEAADENSTGAGMLELAARVAEDGRRVVVIGAGLIGTETAATLAARHAVTLVDLLDRPLARFLPELSEAALGTLGELGVRFLGDARIEEVVANGSGSVVRTSTHGDLDCDVVVSAAGFRTSLPQPLAPDGRSLTVDVDGTLRVIGLEGVFACGDCIAFPHPRYGRLAIPHWDNALHSGRQAADGVLDIGEAYARDPYFFSDIGPLRIQQVGLAADAVHWRDEDGLLIGRDAADRVTAVVFLNAPARLREARDLLAAAIRP
jgi:3-phenylpropionate/trans-cinnamate dioxygenase ferredoxin reductase component